MVRITATQACEFLADICKISPVIPVMIVNDISTARGLGEALVSGGLPILEVTLRTESALGSIAEMANIKGAIVGAGTLLTPKDVENALDAGAKFGVSPGVTDQLIDACETMGLPLLAGAASASEAMRLFERGYIYQKFFPAEAAGGVAMLKSLSSPLPQITFCPTGGISLGNAQNYLDLPNVTCVGGSWVAPSAIVAQKNWDKIQELAQTAVLTLKS